jgi:UDP-N-acetylglucosamine acyltransferase
MIHETAVVGPDVELGEGVRVGPCSVIEGRVKIGRGTRIRGHSVIEGWTEIGEDCDIFPFVSLGLDPQSRGYRGEETWVRVGDGVTIREQVTIHRGTVEGGGETTVGSGTLLMVGCHIAHDCRVGKNVQMANRVGLTGHVHIGDGVVCGGNVGFAPFVRIGPCTFVTASSSVRCHCPPYGLVFPEYRGEGLLRSPNYVGMERMGKSKETIRMMRHVFNILFQGEGTYRDNVGRLDEDMRNCPEVEEVLSFLNFCPLKVNTMRLLSRYRRPLDEAREDENRNFMI